MHRGLFRIDHERAQFLDEDMARVIHHGLAALIERQPLQRW
jgi:hypothetical protein